MILIPSTMTWTLLSALALMAILVYFGIHVLGRKVIFVDLAMAQIAALGAAVGVLMQYELEHSPWGIFGYSLAFTLLASVVFSITKMKSDEVPHEAIIGITYAVAVAATLIVLAPSAVGPLEFERMMKGELQFATWEKMQIPLAIFAGVGLLHFFCRKQFFALSFGSGESRLWDFLFYASLGLVVTSSVRIAGVFLVFCLLVIPAVGSFLFSHRTSHRLAAGWIGGAVLCVAGVSLSYHAGWPTSPAIVAAFAGALVVAGVVRYVLRSEKRAFALARVGAFAAGFAFFGVGLWVFRHREEDPFQRAMHLAHNKSETDRLQALQAFRDSPARKNEWLPIVREWLEDPNPDMRAGSMRLLIDTGDVESLPRIVKLLRDPEDHVREQCVDALHALGRPEVVKDLLEAGDQEVDANLRLSMYEEALEFGSKEAVDRLLAFLGSDIPKRPRERGFKALAPHVDFPQVLSRGSLESCTEWWKTHRDRMVWREVDGHYRFTLE